MSKLQLEVVLQTVNDQFCQLWYSELAQSNKLDTLKGVNKVFSFEIYMSCISIETHMVAHSRFRCSAHKLMIEEGRYRNIARMHLLCQYCNMNILEDEFHFLLVCPAYKDIRTSILPNYYRCWPTK